MDSDSDHSYSTDTGILDFPIRIMMEKNWHRSIIFDKIVIKKDFFHAYQLFMFSLVWLIFRFVEYDNQVPTTNTYDKKQQNSLTVPHSELFTSDVSSTIDSCVTVKYGKLGCQVDLSNLLRGESKLYVSNLIKLSCPIKV